jgi:hypothetical protein
MWQLKIFVCSENKQANSKYLVKCVVCEQHHSSFVRQYNGSKPFLEHAESCHPKEPKVVEWIHQKAVQKTQKAQERAEEERKLKQIRLFWICRFNFVSSYS